MHIYFVLQLPFLITILVAAFVCYKRQRFFEMTTLTVLGIMLDTFICFIFKEYYLLEDLSIVEMYIKTIANISLLPLTHVFIVKRLGDKWSLSSLALYVPILIGLMNGSSIFLGTHDPESGLACAQPPFTLAIFENDNLLLCMYCVDICVILQGIYAVWRLLRLYRILHINGYKFSQKFKFLFTWMIVLSVFLMLNFNLLKVYQYGTIATFTILLVFFLLFTIGYILIIKEFDVKPVLDEQGEDVPLSLDEKLENLARNFVKLMEEEEFYLNHFMTLDMVAGELRTNRTYIQMMMKKHFQKSFLGYLHDLRIARARDMLVNKTEMTIDDIAFDCGYDNISTFGKTFKQRMNVTPSAFRKTALAQQGSDRCP